MNQNSLRNITAGGSKNYQYNGDDTQNNRRRSRFANSFHDIDEMEDNFSQMEIKFQDISSNSNDQANQSKQSSRSGNGSPKNKDYGKTSIGDRILEVDTPSQLQSNSPTSRKYSPFAGKNFNSLQQCNR